MPNFRTSYESRKWSQLERLANETLSTMKGGKAGKSELERLRQIVSEFGSVLVDALNASVSSMHEQAEQRLARIDEHRTSKNKSPLSADTRERLYDQALDDVIKTEAIGLAVTIEDSLREQFKQQNSQFETLLDTKFQSYVYDESAVLAGIEGLEQRLDNAENSLQSYLRRKLEGQSSVDQTSSSASVFGGTPSASPVEEAYPAKEDGLAAKLNDLNENLKGIGDNLNPDRLQQKKKKEEDSRADSWWRRLSMGTFGRLKDIVSSKIGGLVLAGGIVALLGKMLLTQLTGTDTWSGIWDKIEEYVSPKSLAKYGGQFLDYITQKARSLIKWIVDKVSNVFSLSPETQAEHALAPNNTLAATGAKSQGRYEQLVQQAEEAKADGNESRSRMLMKAAEMEKGKAEAATSEINVNMQKAESILPGSSAGATPSGPVHTVETGGGAAMFPNRRLANQQRRREQAAAGGTTEVKTEEISPSKGVTMDPNAPSNVSGQPAGSTNSQGASIPSMESIPYATAMDASFALFNSAALVK